MARVAVLTPDVSENCVGRAHVLARLLQPEHEVAIVGPRFGPGVWPPLATETAMPIEGVAMPRTGRAAMADGWRQVVEAMRRRRPDAVVVSKPFATSIEAARALGVPLLLDIDDWEPGILADANAGAPLPLRLRRALRDRRSLHHRQAWNVRKGDRLARGVPHRTVSNRFLEQRYGGRLVWHARDTRQFDPARADAAAARRRLGLAADTPIVMFLGTPRRHKGLEDLADAAAMLADPAARLVIVGADTSPQAAPLRAELERRAAGRLTLLPPQPFADAPRVLAAADVVAIPQRAGPSSQGQMPAKVFDAMAMAKPVAATAVGDLPEVLEGCGALVPPGDPAALARALDGLLADPARRRDLGRKARARCVERYSDDAMRPVMQAALAEAMA